MSATALTLIQRACRRLTMPVPTSAVGSIGDQTALQMVELLNEEGTELATRAPWEELITEVTFTSVATESQGTVDAILGSGTYLNYIINDTLYDRTARRVILGPLSARNWQWQKAAGISGPYSQYRIRGGALRITPTMSAGSTVAFEYVCTLWAYPTGTSGGVGGSGQQRIQADSDESIFPDDIMLAGLVWRWKQAKGLDYSEEFARYERMVADLIGRNATKPRIDMGYDMQTLAGGVVVPEGSWSP